MCVCVFLFLELFSYIVIQPAYVHNEQAMHINLRKGKKSCFFGDIIAAIIILFSTFLKIGVWATTNSI